MDIFACLYYRSFYDKFVTDIYQGITSVIPFLIIFYLFGLQIQKYIYNVFVKQMDRYRSGHNEAVLKTVCCKRHVGSNPTLSAHIHKIG